MGFDALKYSAYPEAEARVTVRCMVRNKNYTRIFLTFSLAGRL